jgi:hypothetical protein
MLNRPWSHFPGAGMVETIDDLRASNPPSNPELWQALTGAPDVYPGYPVGLRAVPLPDPGLKSYFPTSFGRSERVTAGCQTY